MRLLDGINGAETVQAEMGALPAIAHGQRNAIGGNSMLTNKTKKESQTTWG